MYECYGWGHGGDVVALPDTYKAGTGPQLPTTAATYFLTTPRVTFPALVAGGKVKRMEGSLTPRAGRMISHVIATSGRRGLLGE